MLILVDIVACGVIVGAALLSLRHGIEQRRVARGTRAPDIKSEPDSAMEPGRPSSVIGRVEGYDSESPAFEVVVELLHGVVDRVVESRPFSIRTADGRSVAVSVEGRRFGMPIIGPALVRPPGPDERLEQTWRLAEWVQVEGMLVTTPSKGLCIRSLQGRGLTIVNRAPPVEEEETVRLNAVRAASDESTGALIDAAWSLVLVGAYAAFVALLVQTGHGQERWRFAVLAIVAINALLGSWRYVFSTRYRH